MSTVIQISIFVFATLFLSCVNTKKTSNNDENKTTAITETTEQKERLEESTGSTMADLNEHYFSDEIYLALKGDSGIQLSINTSGDSPLGSFFEVYHLLDIHQPMLNIKPNLYRIKFSERTDLVDVIKTLESYPFVQYAELIPINK